MVHAFNQAGHGRGLEEAPDRQLHSERDPDAGGQFGGEQGVAAEVEEVVVHPDLGQAQGLGEQLAEGLLTGRARPAPARVASEHRQRQGPAVHLSVGRQRQLCEDDHGGRHHVLRQRLGEVPAQFGRLGGDVRSWGHVGDQPLVPGRVLADDRHGLVHRGVPGQRGLDLAQLDAEAAQFDLVVGAAQELHAAVGVPAGPVPGPVHPRPRRAEGVGDEAFAGEGTAVEIATGQSGTADVQLSSTPTGTGRRASSRT